MNPTNDNSNPINPIVILPAELFSRLFQFLPVTSTASSMINREWRQAILSDSTLHTEVDLSRLDGWYQMVPISFHLIRLSNLSLNRLVKVTLNLNAFYHEFRFDKEKFPATGLDYLFLTLSHSKASLRTLSLEIKDKDGQRTPPPRVSLSWFEDRIPSFLLTLMDRLTDFPNLKRIELRSPYMISFEVGSASPTRFSCDCNIFDDLKDGYGVGYCSSPLSRDSTILDRAVDYVGGGMTKLRLDSQLGTSPEEARVLEQLSRSQLTLQELDWLSQRRAEAFFSFAMRCPRLTSLSFCSYPEPMHEDAEEVDDEQPQEGEEAETWQLDLEENYIENPSLKELCLSSYLNRPRFDWDALSSWASDSALEVLKITFPGAMIPRKTCNSMLLGSEDSLKQVNLEKVRCKQLEASNSWLFPNLESLSLTSIAPTLFDMFYMMVAPKLTSLTLKASSKDDETYLDHFSMLLKKYETRLTYLSFFQVFSTPQVPQIVQFGS